MYDECIIDTIHKNYKKYGVLGDERPFLKPEERSYYKIFYVFYFI